MVSDVNRCVSKVVDGGGTVEVLPQSDLPKSRAVPPRSAGAATPPANTPWP